MSEFSIAWLDLREQADSNARDAQLLKSVVEALNSQDTSVVVDLGAGTGSILRALKALDANVALWRLVDLNGNSLNEALRRHAGREFIEDHQSDLMIIDELPLIGATLVSASALFDLASAQFVDSLIARLKDRASILYAPLNYDGTTQWSPAHPLDAPILEAFNKDQLTDKGMGLALGPSAAHYLDEVLSNSGYDVYRKSSPWCLQSSDQHLIEQLIHGIAAAAANSGLMSVTDVATWKEFRVSSLDTSQCTVGHTDVLAVPKHSPFAPIIATSLV